MASTPAGAPPRPGRAPSTAGRRASHPEGVQETLDWAGFSTRFFPHCRRHDLEALAAYAAYKHALDTSAGALAVPAAAGRRT
jgi:hypothetical protein